MEYYNENKNEGNQPIKQEKVNTKKFIYLGGLPEDADKYDLTQFILQQGKFNIEMMDFTAGKSYAYIKFKTKDDAQEALKVLHLKEFKNHIIRAEPFKSSQKKDKIKENTDLFVKNLPKDSTPKELYDLFVKYGAIDSINLKRDKNGECIGYGYVDFTSAESAKEAMEKLNQTKFKDSTLAVSLFTPKEKRIENLNNSEYMIPMLIAKKIPEDMDGASFKNIFDIYGQIMISGIINEPPNFLSDNKNKEGSDNEGSSEIYANSRYGIILYTKKEEAQTALNQLQSKYDLVLLPADNNIIEKVKKQKHDSMKAKYEGCNLVVKNLPKEVDDKILYDIFRKYGNISSARVQTQGVMKDIKDEKGNVIDKKFIYECKGFGFVLFKKEQDAQNAKNELNEKEIEVNGLKLKMIVENYDYNKGEKAKIEQFQRDMGMMMPRGGHSMNRGGFPGRGGPGRGRGRGGFPPRGGYHPGMGPNQNNMMGNNMAQMQQQNNFIQMPNQQLGPGANNNGGETRISVESENLYEVIQQKLKIESPEDRTEAIGETLFYFLLKFIPQYGLNTTDGKFDDGTLCSKLTGILIKTEPNILLQIISRTDSLYNSLKDVLNKLIQSNNVTE